MHYGDTLPEDYFTLEGQYVLKPLAFSALDKAHPDALEFLRTAAREISAGSKARYSLTLRRLFETVSVAI